MIVDSPQAFRDAIAGGRFPIAHPTAARAAFLVSPLGFRLAEESATDNRYMDMRAQTSEERALVEHAHLARALAETLPTMTLPGDPDTPDAVFPNNVFATTKDKLILGAMRHEVRRREANRPDIQTYLLVFSRNASRPCQRDCVAELTGPLIVDRGRNIGFCGLTERCDRTGRRSDARRLRPRPDVRLRARSGRVPHQCRDVGAGEPRPGHPSALVPRPRGAAGDRRALRRARARAHRRREGGFRRQLHRALRARRLDERPPRQRRSRRSTAPTSPPGASR